MKNLFIVFLSLFSFAAQAHPNPTEARGQIRGTVIDSLTGTPVDYATISIFRKGSTSPFNGVVTDPKGNFLLTGVAPGEYRVAIDFLGYRRKNIDKVIMNTNSQNLSLGQILITPVRSQLQTVNVVGAAPTIENKIDKLVYNTANDLTSQGGVAIDVLRKVPMITVDIDGNVQLMGSPSIRFLINGKPSTIFGASVTDALQTIPANQIKSIEVITSPGAKYDINGTGGIINIILKDNKLQGVNGTVNLSAGTRRNNGSFNLNMRKGNFGVNASFSGNEQLNSNTINASDNLSYNSQRDTSTRLFQKGSSAFTRGGYRTGLNFNWSITKKDELTASFGYNHFSNHNNGLTNQEQALTSLNNNAIVSDILSLRNSDSRFSEKSFDYSLEYKKLFKKADQELDISYTTSFGNNTVNFFQQQDYLNGGFKPSGLRSDNPGRDHQSEIAIDYVQPLTDNFTLETGVKGEFQNINNTVATDSLSGFNFVPDANQTYGFKYQNKVYAYYLSATFSMFNKFIDGKAGLRDEYTTISSNFPGAHIPSYNVVAPSIVFSHKIDKTQSLKLSYAYRIERPDDGDLNPFYNISDPHNIRTGNPNLKPEIGHNYEFAYNKSFAKGANMIIAAFYRYNNNDIQSFTTHYDTLSIEGTRYPNVYLNQSYNIGTETTEGFNLFGSVPVTGKLNLRTNIMFSDRITANPGSPTVSGFMYRLNLNASYEFGKDLTAEIFGNYNSSQRNLQGTRPAFAFYNLAVRKELLNKKISIGLTAADPFNEYIIFRSTTSGNNFYQINSRQVPFRSFGITFIYKFGKLQVKNDKQKDDNMPDVPVDTSGN
jgi:ferric enterobactin receptor